VEGVFAPLGLAGQAGDLGSVRVALLRPQPDLAQQAVLHEVRRLLLLLQPLRTRKSRQTAHTGME
jgi:hypothetical protein